MKVGDLLYYRPNYCTTRDNDQDLVLGIVVAEVLGHAGETCFKTLWFDDYDFTDEPAPGSSCYSPAVGVLSASW